MKILAVDDDPFILKLLEQIITAVGQHDLQLAESGRQALDIISQSDSAPFDCFMFDIQMPEMDGIELVERVRSLEQYVDTPVLMLTAMSEKRYIDRAFSVGATDYVTKPFEVAELETRLSILRTHAQRREPLSKKIFAARNAPGSGNAPQEQPEFELFEPFSIYDVENVIDHQALENYLAQLSRSSLFGSTIFAVALREAGDLYEALNRFEFYSLISDIAEVISDLLRGHQYLMSYAGNGTFICVTESGWRPDVEKLKDVFNLTLARSEFFNNSGEALFPRVETGEAIRLVWKSGSSLYEALAAAHTSAEEAVQNFEREKGNIWITPSRDGANGRRNAKARQKRRR